MLTLAEAAKETGLTKPAIFKSIQKGRVSATKDDKGQWRIDPAELFRVYPPAAKKAITETQTGNLELLLKLKGCDRSIPKTCAVDHLCQCWRFAYLIDMRVKSNGWGANDFQPSRWEEMSYQVNVKHASRHTTKMRIPQALDF
jgi:hypothetical protein